MLQSLSRYSLRVSKHNQSKYLEILLELSEPIPDVLLLGTKHGELLVQTSLSANQCGNLTRNLTNEGVGSLQFV